MNGYKPANRQSRSNDFTFLLLNQITALTSVIAPDAIEYYVLLLFNRKKHCQISLAVF